MARSMFDHVALLVADLDAAVRDYTEILRVLDPTEIREVVCDHSIVDGCRVRWATFVKEDGGACIQLIESELPKDRELLSGRGECIHHIAFCSPDVRETSRQLLSAGIPVLHPEPVHAVDRPWMTWNFISPRHAHGVLVEISQEYKVKNGTWVKP